MISSVMGSPHVSVKANIKDMRLRTVLIFEHRHSLGRNYFCYRIIRISQVREPARTERAAFDACRHHSLGNTVVTEVALVSDLVVRMEEADTVRACHDAVAATDAPFPVDQNDAVVRLVSRPDGTDLNTCGVVTLIAEFGYKIGLGNIIRINFFIPDLVGRETVSPTKRRV